MIVDPSPNQEHQGPPKLQQSVIIFRRLLDKTTDFYEILNLSLLSSKEHNKNQIMDPRPSQEPPLPPKLMQSVIILLEGS